MYAIEIRNIFFIVTTNQETHDVIFRKESLAYYTLVPVNRKDTPGKGARCARGNVEPNSVRRILRGSSKPPLAGIRMGVHGESGRKVGCEGEDGWHVYLSCGDGD